MDEDQFQTQKSRANGALRNALGAQPAAPYLIDDDGERPFTRYRLTLPPAAVRFASATDADSPSQAPDGAV